MRNSLFRFAITLALSCSLAACGGGGAASPGTPALPSQPNTNTPSTTSTSSAPMSVVAYNSESNALSIAGTIVQLFPGGFQIQGGAGVGFFNVHTSSSTSYVGGTPSAGETVEATGTGNPNGDMTSTTSVQVLPTVTGPIVSTNASGFQMVGPSNVGHINIAVTRSTIVTGSAPFVGENVTVSGTGSLSTSLTAVAVSQNASGPTPSPSPSSNPQTVTGPVTMMRPGGFQMQGGRGIGFMYIWVTSSTVVGGPQPYVGENITVSGVGVPDYWLLANKISPAANDSPTPAPTATPNSTPTPNATPTPSTGFTPPPTTAFMPSSWGKVSAFQVFDDTGNGYISQAAAAADGYRYSTVWGARNNIGTAWLDSNPSLQMGYYDALETDASSTAWGAIGHTLSWWQANHPDWILYACTSGNTPTTTPAWVPGLSSNVPLDIHNPSVVAYQISSIANYAHAIGYTALSIDEATFWQADEGVPGGYGCGIYQNGSFVRRYSGSTDANWEADVVAWVKQAHEILTTDPVISHYHLKLVVNHPADSLTADEQTFLANVDADLDETGYSDYGNYKTSNTSNLVVTAAWAKYAQDHGTAVLMNDNWGSTPVGTAQLDYSVATYLMGNEQAESLFASPGNGYGLEQYHSQYAAAIGAPCGEMYGAGDSHNPAIYYRRFASAIVVVNGGSGSSNETAYLPSGHTFSDMFGRPVSNPLTIDSNDGYVLMTSNGCN